MRRRASCRPLLLSTRWQMSPAASMAVPSARIWAVVGSGKKVSRDAEAPLRERCSSTRAAIPKRASERLMEDTITR